MNLKLLALIVGLSCNLAHAKEPKNYNALFFAWQDPKAGKQIAAAGAVFRSFIVTEVGGTRKLLLYGHGWAPVCSITETTLNSGETLESLRDIAASRESNISIVCDVGTTDVSRARAGTGLNATSVTLTPR